MYAREGLMEAVYDCIANNVPLDTLHVPHSDVFYVREALEDRYGRSFSLMQAEEYMREAGWSDSGNN